MTVLVLAVLALPTIMTTILLAEILAGFAPLRSDRILQFAGQRVTLLMPAHDEAAILDAIIDRLAPEIEGWARLLIVADNCIDETANIARARGLDVDVDVVERRDASNRGKGFALDHGRAHLRADPPDAVIVFDADCVSDRASLQALAASALGRNRPCQAIYLITPVAGAAPLVQLSNFAFMIKNLIRQRGLQRLAGRVHLVGTGMAFPWALFDRAPLATANIVEDVELGLALDRAGTPPQLVSSATTWSDPSSIAGTLIQRTRWEGGFLALARRTAPRALGEALRRVDPRAVCAALDLYVPPLTLLVVIDAGALIVATVLTWATGVAWTSVGIFVALLVLTTVSLGVAWAREGRRFIGAGTLLRIPLYILWKIPLYLGLARGKPTEWLRPGR